MSTPYARDRTKFDATTCRQPGGYQVGPKAAECWFTDYDDALRFLLSSSVPYWRRPSATSGIFGIVTGVGFTR